MELRRHAHAALSGLLLSLLVACNAEISLLSSQQCAVQLATVAQAFPPGSAFYEQAVTIDNGRIHLHPAVIVVPTDKQEVAAVLQEVQTYGACQGLPFSVLNGGHSANGYCLNNGGIVLDVSGLNKTHLDVEQQTLTVGSGQIWINLYNLVLSTNSSLVPIGGGCPTVGVSGFTQGGGISFLSRSYGLGADNVLGLSLVVPNGTLVDLNVAAIGAYTPELHAPDSEQALLWALMGGGGGNWGVLTELTIKLYEARDDMLEAQLCWPLSESTTVIPCYSEWASKLPPEMAAYGWYGSQEIPGLSGLMFCTTIVYNGPFEQGLPLLEPMMALNPVVNYIDNLPFLEWELGVNGNFTAVEERSAYIRSGFFPSNGLTEEVGEIIAEAMASAPSAESTVLWDHVAGAIANKSASETAYVHRDSMFAFEVKAIWENPRDEAANVAWAVHLGESLLPFQDGSYVNYIDPLLENWQTKYYGENYEQLLKVKASIDPTNFFKFQQSIGSDYSPPKKEQLLYL